MSHKAHHKGPKGFTKVRSLCGAALLGDVENCVVTLMRWRGRQHLLFAIDQVGGIEGRNLETVAMGDGIGRAGFYAISAKDAAVVVNVIDLGIALGAGDAVLRRILCRLDVNAVGRASGGA